ncbi:MAG: hypothetical protein WAU70_17780 [Flavobacteriales bacterium]
MKRRSELVLIALPLFAACGYDPVPKEKAYFRIDLPEQAFVAWEGECFSAELPAYSVMEQHKSGGRCWEDWKFADQRAQVYLTYKSVNGDLGRLIEDAHDFKSKHQSKAVRIKSDRVLRDSSRVFGTVFIVDGDVASPMVFYLTDSTSRFLYGSLYFNTRPNADSLAPVTERLRSDIAHFVATLQWH